MEKNGYFPTNFFQAIQGSKISFTIFQNEKTPFYAIEIRGSKSRKIDIFHGFGLKMAIFPTFFLGNIGRENVFYDILQRKNAFLAYKNKTFQKLEKLHFSKGVNRWYWQKNGHFSNFFFLGNIGQENVFYDILERKNTFLGYKKKGSKSRKIDIFPKGLTHGLGQEVQTDENLTFFQRG